MLNSKFKKLIWCLFLLVTGAGINNGVNAAESGKGTQIKKGRFEKVVLAAGCFWGTEEFFRQLPGVVATRVGYTGGGFSNPTYEDMHDGHTGHAESVEVVFDPSIVTFDQLLDSFFKMHDPTTMNRQGNDVGTQYRSAIFYQTAEQLNKSMAFIDKVKKSKQWNGPITTEVSALGQFWEAEDYHQKYLLKHPGGYDNHFLRKINFDR